MIERIESMFFNRFFAGYMSMALVAIIISAALIAGFGLGSAEAWVLGLTCGVVMDKACDWWVEWAKLRQQTSAE